jgi:hypothetical protein
MTDTPHDAISWASTLAQCFEGDSTLHAQHAGASVEAPSQQTPHAARYTPVGVIGQGGMGRVIAATDEQFGRTVALKEMTVGAGDQESIRRFLLESIVTANLEHPGVVPVYERGVREGAPYYAMRKVSGRTLSAAIAATRTPAERLALVPAVIRAAHALGFAHERGVVHRDVKPDNIILGDHGETVILDWGIAKVRGLPDGHRHDSPLGNVVASAGEGTLAGAILGTPSYMAPEQAHGDIAAIDPRTDVFALGAVLYEVLSGRPPYREPTLVLTLSAASQAQFDAIDRAAPKAPAGLRAIVARALSKSPSDRFEDGAALARALEDFQARAWLGDDSIAARWFARALAVLGVFTTVVTGIAIWKGLPSLRELGVGSFMFVLAGVGSIALAALEWFTRGRARVLGLALSLAAASALMGLGNAAGGMVAVLRGASADAVVQDAQRWRALVSLGMYESIGNAAGGCSFAAIAAVILALVHRRNAQLAEQHAR